jgi:regulator of sigma E protease
MGVINLLGYILPFIAAIVVIVFIHELGHFLVARWFGVRVEAFSVGFGKKLFGWKDSKGTEWRICALPIGGYVKFEGDENAASFPSADQGNTSEGNFHTKPVWQRALVVAAGPFANFLLAIAIFAAAFSLVGIPHYSARVSELPADSAAKAAGILAGDWIREIDGVTIKHFGDIQSYVRVRPGQDMTVVVERNGERLTYPVTSRAVELDDGFGGKINIGQIGIGRDPKEELVITRMGPVEAVSEATKQTWSIITTTLRYLKRMVVGQESVKMIGGPGMMAKGAGDAASNGFTSFVAFVAFISVSIGLVNLFPVPMLDGGHLVFYAIEALRGKPLGPKAQEWGFRIGLSFVIMLMLLGTTNDLFRWLGMGT